MLVLPVLEEIISIGFANNLTIVVTESGSLQDGNSERNKVLARQSDWSWRMRKRKWNTLKAEVDEHASVSKPAIKYLEGMTDAKLKSRKKTYT